MRITFLSLVLALCFSSCDEAPPSPTGVEGDPGVHAINVRILEGRVIVRLADDGRQYDLNAEKARDLKRQLDAAISMLETAAPAVDAN